MEIIIIIIAILVVVDIYLRFRNHTDNLTFLLLSNDVINKTLVNKGLIKREEVDKARKEVLENLKITNPKDYKRCKKSLRRKGIDIEMGIEE